MSRSETKPFASRIPTEIKLKMEQIKAYSGLSLNDQIIQALMMYQFQMISPMISPMISNQKPTKSKNDITDDIKKAPLARVVHNLHYTLYNNNNIEIYSQNLENAWKDYLKHRSERGKAIRKKQMKRKWVRYQKIIDEHGVDMLVECFKLSVEKDWLDINPDWVMKIRAGESVTEYKEEFTDDD